jgi:hypothetical protein
MGGNSRAREAIGGLLWNILQAARAGIGGGLA